MKEMEIMKTHTTKGYEIIKGFKLNDDEEQERYSLDIAKYHHERWDGRGYPEGLKRGRDTALESDRRHCGCL